MSGRSARVTNPVTGEVRTTSKANKAVRSLCVFLSMVVNSTVKLTEKNQAVLPVVYSVNGPENLNLDI